MRPQDFVSLALSRYELRLTAQRATSLPPFLGSTLRGAFGHALKEVVYVMDHRDCGRCLVADRYLYPYLFEMPIPADVPQLRGQQKAPHPFILAPPNLLKTLRIENGSTKEPHTTGSRSDECQTCRKRQARLARQSSDFA